LKKVKKTPGGIGLCKDVEEMASRVKRCVYSFWAAHWGPEDLETGIMKRRIGYTTARTDEGEEEIEVTGAFLMTMNARPNTVMPEVEALSTRIVIYEFRPEREELVALADKIALNGHSMILGGQKRQLSPTDATAMWAYWRDNWPAERHTDLRFLITFYRLWLGTLARGLKRTGVK
jgi:hypothetical protein